MDSKTKIILTVIGLAALIVPVVLIVVMPNKNVIGKSENVGSGGRQIRQDEVQKELNNNPLKNINTGSVAPSPYRPSTAPSPVPSAPTIATPPLESTPASSVN